MVASTDIKFYVHTNNSAPQLQNAYGSMINVLDACLVNGINIGTVSSLTTSGTIVTALFSSAHNLMQYQVIKITGANQPEFNGEHRVLTIPNAQSITFELAAAPSTATATGTITASLSPLGWEKPFSSTHSSGVGGKAAYRSLNLLLPSRPFLRVVDELDPAYTATYAKYAKVGIVEDMTDIDTMLGAQAPYDSALPNKNWNGTGSGSSAYNGWAKWYYARSGPANNPTSATATTPNGERSWLLVGNKDYFYLLPAHIASDDSLATYGFGSFKSLLNVDNSCSFLSANIDYVAASPIQGNATKNGLCGAIASQEIAIQRKYDQLASSGFAVTQSLNGSSVTSGSGNYIGAYSLTGIAPLLPIFIKESSSNVLRGEIQNLYWLYQQRPYEHKQILVHGQSAYMALIAATTNTTTIGQIVIKIGDL